MTGPVDAETGADSEIMGDATIELSKRREARHDNPGLDLFQQIQIYQIVKISEEHQFFSA